MLYVSQGDGDANNLGNEFSRHFHVVELKTRLMEAGWGEHNNEANKTGKHFNHNFHFGFLLLSLGQ